MRKIKPQYYIIMLIISVIIMAFLTAITIDTDTALNIVLAGSGGTIGLTIGIIIRQKTDFGKEIDALSIKARRQLIAFLIACAILTIAAIALIFKYQ